VGPQKNNNRQENNRPTSKKTDNNYIKCVKCTKFDFSGGSSRWPGGSLQRSPRPHSWIWVAARGRGRGWAEEEERKGRGRGREGEVEGRDKEGPQVTVKPRPLRALLRHASDL